MQKSHCTEERSAFALRQAEGGTKVMDRGRSGDGFTPTMRHIL